MLKNLPKALLIGMVSITQVSYAIAHMEKRTIIAPTCLVEKSHIQFEKIDQYNDFILMRVDEENINALAAHKHIAKCGGFKDVSRAWLKQYKSVKGIDAKHFLREQLKPLLRQKISEYKIQYAKDVSDVFKVSNPQRMWTDLTTLTSFKDRYANSKTGVETAEWLKENILAIAKATQHEDDVSVRFVKTSGYIQPSVVVKFGKSNDAGIVIGGHMDTLRSNFYGNKPGADDDGSGSVTVLETARSILTSGKKFKKPIYFIFYAAEELGTVGSQDVVADFKQQAIPVDAVLQMDMTGYANRNEETMWLIKDNVDMELTHFLEQLINHYVFKDVKYTACGYECSDHTSWTNEGFAAAMPFEANFQSYNPYIHTVNDTMDHLSLAHMSDYLSLAIAFAVELAEPIA